MTTWTLDAVKCRIWPLHSHKCCPITNLQSLASPALGRQAMGMLTLICKTYHLVCRSALDSGQQLHISQELISEFFWHIDTSDKLQLISLSRGWATELRHCRFKYVYWTSVNSATTFFNIVTSHSASSGPRFGSCVHHLSFAFPFGEWGIANWTRFWHQLGSMLLEQPTWLSSPSDSHIIILMHFVIYCQFTNHF